MNSCHIFHQKRFPSKDLEIISSPIATPKSCNDRTTYTVGTRDLLTPQWKSSNTSSWQSCFDCLDDLIQPAAWITLSILLWVKQLPAHNLNFEQRWVMDYIFNHFYLVPKVGSKFLLKRAEPAFPASGITVTDANLQLSHFISLLSFSFLRYEQHQHAQWHSEWYSRL